MSLWRTNGAEFFEIESPNVGSFKSIQKDLASLSKQYPAKVLARVATQVRAHLIAKTCTCDSTIKDHTKELFEKHDFMEIPPEVMTGGWEHYRLVGFDNSDLRGLLLHLGSIGKTEILYKRNIAEGVTDEKFTISLSNLFGQLTEKQLKALVSAIQAGYYDIPKRVKTVDLARRDRRSRTTFEEHIRKAESKLVYAIAPLMMMYIPNSRKTQVGREFQATGTH